MKTFTYIIALLTFSISLGQNLLENGNFEDGNTNDGWNDNLSGQAYTYGSDAVQVGFTAGTYTLQATHGGTYAGRLKPQDAAFIQVENVTPGETYNVQFWFANSFIFPDIAARIRDFTGDANGSFLSLTPIVSDSGLNAGDATKYGCKVDSNDGTLSSWKEAKFSFIIPEGVTKIKFQYFAGSTMGNNFVDDASLTLESTASVTDLSKFNFKSYPNPSKDFIQISAENNIDKIEIYNLLGQEKMNQIIARKTSELNISSLSSGLYLIKAYIQDSVGTYKFIKE